MIPREQEVKYMGMLTANPIHDLAITEMNMKNKFFFCGCHNEHVYAKCTPVEIAKALVEEISDEEDDRAGDSRPFHILPPSSSPICPKENLLKSNNFVESKQGNVESLLPMVNLAAWSMS
ncbi:hypothetical protein WN944_003287 [Citrus x changshan-huyou]|uniref:Uncharacterized protein n=1 Tax=Citrus x changshan-huyou TaxID=2935761 RepID=A0AAP0M4H0_9ROSI